MRIAIEIPKEFEEHFNQDKFKDSLERIMADIKHSLENGDCLCSGRYEYETIEMLQKSFENSKPSYSVDKVVDELESFAKLAEDRWTNGTSKHAYQERKCWVKAIEIVKHGCVSDDACEWQSASDGEFIQNPHTKRLYSNEPSMKNIYCNTCGKKIKVVE